MNQPSVAATVRAAVMTQLVLAAKAGAPCPTNPQIARAIGAKTAAHISLAVKALEVDGAISVDRGHASRVVTINASGLMTAPTVSEKAGRRPAEPSVSAKAQRAYQAVPIGVRSAIKRVSKPENYRRGAPATRGVAGRHEPDRKPIVLQGSRDPCPRCGVRGDIGCKHREAWA